MKKTHYVLVHKITKKFLPGMSSKEFGSMTEAALYALQQGLHVEIVPVDSGTSFTPPGSLKGIGD